MQQGEPILLGKQPRGHQTHCGGEGIAVGSTHPVAELVQGDLETHPRNFAETLG